MSETSSALDILSALDGVSTAALCLLLAVLFIRGIVVARWTFDEKAREAEEWRAESRLKDEQLRARDEQLQVALEVGKTVDAILQSLPRGGR